MDGGVCRPDPGVDGRSDVLSHPKTRVKRPRPAENLVGEESPDTAGQDAGRGPQGPSPGGARQGASTESATENIPPEAKPEGKGEKVG